ncbi:MAG: type VI secretion system baseplate subunit TssE [Rhodospirillales bacterium]|nr:type VI secretion system baseplate subunit TssE [Rhodospirillales bacterium]MDE2458792.1 type VI secretion system baseplate subunit TssE [Rhodospirillales bacterium]
MNDDTLSRGANANLFIDRMRDSGARVKLSVLDRLLDDTPEMERDRPLSATEALSVLRRAVRRDLEALLNGRRRLESVPAGLTELANSSFTFGLPDFTAGAMQEDGARELLRREIERSIRQFEPRLVQVAVKLVPAKEDASTTLHFRIDALLHADPAPEPISFETLVNAATTDIAVAGGEIG